MLALDWAHQHNACDKPGQAIDWIRELPKGTTVTEAWYLCKRADWLIWILGKVVPLDKGAHDRELRLLACDIAERALVRAKKAGKNPDMSAWEVIETARRYALGQVTWLELHEAGCRVDGVLASMGPKFGRLVYAIWAARDTAHDDAIMAASEISWESIECAEKAPEHKWQCDQIRRRFKPVDKREA